VPTPPDAPLQCGKPGDRYGGRLFEGYTIRLPRECRLGSTSVLGESALCGAGEKAEHRIAGLQLRYVPANGLHLTGYIGP
jgi:hypothetical protein